MGLPRRETKSDEDLQKKRLFSFVFFCFVFVGVSFVLYIC